MHPENTAVDMVEIRRLCDRFVAASSAKDVERIMSAFAPDVVSFDIVPPLRRVGAEQLREHWIRTFAAHAGPIAYEIHDLDIEVSGDLAVTHSLNWKSGTLVNGQLSELWLRWTTSMHRFDSDWLTTHEHVSVPTDPATSAALPGLTP